MELVVDTSVVIAVITGEGCREELVAATRNADLLAPSCLPWEIGNAFSAMFRRGRLSLSQARTALTAYRGIPVRLVDIDLSAALGVAHELGVYAYDAYFIACAQRQRCSLISLDGGLLAAAARASVQTIEVAT